MRNFFTKIRSSRGDTIVEVMIALVVLSLVIATVYSMGARSLRAGTESNQRTEALSYAQSQIDLLINAKNNDPNFANNYQVSQAFCLNPDGTKNTSAQSTSDKLCPAYNGSPYSVGVSYSNNLFVITTHWPSQDAPGGTANMNLYYKLPGIYKKALVNATTATVSGITATINGTVNPNSNIVTDCYFNYDTSTSYSSPTKVACSSSPGSGTTDVAVSATISGLQSNTTYFFQLCATNLVGTACSVNNGTFTTPARPTISNEAANNTVSPSGNNADLVAQVNPNGTSVSSCYFEWGTTTAYGSSKNCGGTIGAGTSPVSTTVNVAPLTAGTTYHFRVVATNAAGTTTGGDHTFVPSQPTLTATISASPTSVSYGGSSNISWSSNANSCNASGSFSTGGQPNGTASTVSLTSTTDFSVTCYRGSQSVTSSPVRVNVSPPAPSISYFNAGSEGTIYTTKGVPRTLQWATSNASSCTSNWAGGVGVNSSSNITAYNGTTYTLTCYNSAGTSAQSNFSFNYVYSNACLYSAIDWGGSSYCYDENTDPGYLAAHGSYGANWMLGQASSIWVNSGIASVWSNYGVCHDFDFHNYYPANRFTDIYGGNGTTFNDNVNNINVGKNCAGR